jgi:CheY-like chemotaxis protein
MSSKKQSLRILLVDDYKSIRKKMAADLTTLGHQVTEAGNGVEALTTLRSGSFDLLITDLVMPEMDGFELCEEVRKTTAVQNIPIVVVSTHCDSRYVMKALRLGADDYITKPMDHELVERVIARALTPTLANGSTR